MAMLLSLRHRARAWIKSYGPLAASSAHAKPMRNKWKMYDATWPAGTFARRRWPRYVPRDLAVKRSDSLSPAPLGEGRREREVGGSKKINEPSMFCVVYCFLSRFARARVSLNKRRALLAVSWRPAVPYLRAAARR